MQIYIHIPFCEQKCDYCRFASVGNSQKFLIEKYVRYLCKEISSSTPCGWPNASDQPQGVTLQKISTIYFGWWTPWVLSLEQLEKIFTILREKFTFSNDIEISLESTPDRVTPENVEWWKNLWITRLSMWVQTLNNKSLQAIWRGNKWDIEIALENIEEHYKSCTWNTNPSPFGYLVCPNYSEGTLWKREIVISLDFIIWLPHVGKWETLRDIRYILEKYSFVKHISVYMLEDYYNEDKIIETSFDKKTYPEDWDKIWIMEDDYLWEYTEISKYLRSKWYAKYEISNFAQPWYECRHNIWYWNHSEIAAFWLWAYWLIKNIIPSILQASSLKTNGRGYEYMRYANSEKFVEYYAWKKIHETELTQQDIFLETVMFQLRTSWLQEVIYNKLNQEKIEYFLENKYLEKKSNKIVLLDKWVLVMDYILSEIV